MRELARSMMRLSWTAPLYGAAQLAGVLRPEAAGDGTGAQERLGSSLDAIAWSGHRHLGFWLQAAFQAGDDLQREWLDEIFDAVQVGSAAGVAGSLAVRTAAAVWRAGEVARIALPGAGGTAARRELRNKLEVYFLVRSARERLGLPPPGEPFELMPFVERALELDPYRALWVMEGLGHDYAGWILRRQSDPEGILSAERPPPAALLMLHAGLGLALAEHVLAELRPGAAATSEVGRALARFVRLCRRNSRPGFADAALESLGLVTRCFYPDLVLPVGRRLEGLAGPLPGYYWHGVGRAIYFLPVNFLPGYGSISHAVAMARREAPHTLAETSSVAGVVYAAVLVNLSHPEILEELLRGRGETLGGGAFSEGVVSAVLMRRATTPGDPGLGVFLRHRPDSADARLSALWHLLVTAPLEATIRDPGRSAAGDVYRALTDSGEFEGLTAPRRASICGPEEAP